MASDDEGRDWPRQLLTGLGAVVVASLVVGLVVGAVALGAARVLGLGGGSASSGASAQPSLYWPSTSPSPATSGSASPSQAAAPSETPVTSPPRHRRRQAITLTASPTTASGSERVNLTGRYRGGDGAQLQVQRNEGGQWTDFPTSATVRDGRFATYIMTSHTGRNRFRVLDKSTGRASRPVTVVIR